MADPLGEEFIPNPEYNEPKFDPNVRYRHEDIPNKTLYENVLGYQPVKAPQSCYVAVNHKGKTWHLFNAARMPLGRMAVQIATYIRGKHKPTYNPQSSGSDGDVCVVVNAAK